jgi:vacuolar-type H+-ATPase subunit E/Vma4
MDELITALNNYAKAAELTERELRKAREIIAEVKESIVVAENSIYESKSGDARRALLFAKDEALEAGRSIYISKVTEAAASSEEYAYNSLLSPLVEIADESDLYKTTFVGSNWSTALVVNLAMDEIAGSLEDYANAVSSAREALGIKEGRDPVRASAFWKDKIYQGPRYFTTIRTRLAQTAGRAPYWSLLNNGNKSTGMSSDIGGTAYPEVRPTHFVEETEAAIANEFRLILGRYQMNSAVYIQDLQLMIGEANRAIARIYEKIESIAEPPEQMKIVAEAIGADVKLLSGTKVHRAKEKIKSGEYVPAQISIQAPGQKRKRIRRARFMALSGLGE